MKIRIFVLTYRDPHHLNSGLKSLFDSDLSQHRVEVNIINNHSDFQLNDEYKDKVNVLHNVLRLDRSTGNTSQNWNEALMLGFNDLNNPECDLVITAQDDIFFGPQWLNLLTDTHKKIGFQFISVGAGDTLCSYTPEAVKKIGMWDERYSSLAFMDHDYFIRAAMHLGNYASITDTGHTPGLYTIYPLPWHKFIVEQPPRSNMKLELKKPLGRWQRPAQELFKAKWGGYSEELNVSTFINKPRKPGITGYIRYPYFEKDVEDLVGKGYNLEHGWVHNGYVEDDNFGGYEQTPKEQSISKLKEDDYMPILTKEI